jgi:hypothetical protein
LVKSEKGIVPLSVAESIGIEPDEKRIVADRLRWKSDQGGTGTTAPSTVISVETDDEDDLSSVGGNDGSSLVSGSESYRRNVPRDGFASTPSSGCWFFRIGAAPCCERGHQRHIMAQVA